MENSIELSRQAKAELACKLALLDAIEFAQKNKNDSSELKQLKVQSFIKTPAFKRSVNQYFEIISNYKF